MKKLRYKHCSQIFYPDGAAVPRLLRELEQGLKDTQAKLEDAARCRQRSERLCAMERIWFASEVRG